MQNGAEVDNIFIFFPLQFPRKKSRNYSHKPIVQTARLHWHIINSAIQQSRLATFIAIVLDCHREDIETGNSALIHLQDGSTEMLTFGLHGLELKPPSPKRPCTCEASFIVKP